VRFSPDGRWVVAGGEDGTVKIWDLTAGKLLHDFQQRSAAVVALDFHPHEFVMASGGADGVVTFWDLETFDLIANAVPRYFPFSSILTTDQTVLRSFSAFASSAPPSPQMVPSP
jgi:WD40 repeat protein